MISPVRCRVLLACVIVLSAMAGRSLAQSETGGVPLPVRKVVLYKNGMGYFEHLGDVRGAQTVDLVLSGTQLNDVLKSLTVIDLAPAPVVSVTYDSTKPVDRELSELPIKLGNFSGLASFLNEIRGTEVELDVPGGAVSGRLVGAELRKKEIGAAAIEMVDATLFLPGGELRTLDVASARALRLRGRDVSAAVQRYLELVDVSQRQNVRHLRIQTGAAGTRKLFVGYTSEAPIWKTTYRIVLDSGKKPLLQGWAIVDNTTAMDWENVELALVAGAPISFVQRLSEPIYAKRQEVPVADALPTTPLLHAPALAAAPAPTVSSARAAPQEFVRAREAMAPLPETRSVGEQFEYRLPHPVTLGRNHSAIFPIVHAEIDAEKVAIWNPRTGEEQPRSGLWITNTSNVTLAPGAFTVIESGGFGGEGLTETIQAGERRLLSYGVDLAMSVIAKALRTSERVERVIIRNGVINWQIRTESEVMYSVNNRGSRSRSVVIEHPTQPQYVLATNQIPAPVESTAAVYRFRVGTPARSGVELTVRTQKPETQTTAIDSRLGREQLRIWVRERRIDASVEQVLAPVVESFEEIQQLANSGAKVDEETKRIFEDQARVREMLGKLGQTPEEAALRLRYVQQLVQQEKRLETLRAEKSRLDTAQADAERRVDQLVKNLTLDRAL